VTPPRDPRARGLTLIEIVVTLAILGMVLVLIWSIMVGFLDSQQRVEATLLEERAGEAILAVMSRDLNGVYAYGVQDGFVGKQDGQGATISFVTTVEPSQELLEQDEEKLAQARARTLATGTAALGNPEEPFQEPPRPAKMTRVTYFVEASADDSRFYTLFRREEEFIPPPPPPPDPAPGAGAAGGTGAGAGAGGTGTGGTGAAATTVVDIPLAEGEQGRESVQEVYDRVRSIAYRYAFEGQWREAWEEAGKVPEAVEITIEVEPASARYANARYTAGDPRLKKYRTIIALPVQNPQPAN